MPVESTGMDPQLVASASDGAREFVGLCRADHVQVIELDTPATGIDGGVVTAHLSVDQPVCRPYPPGVNRVLGGVGIGPPRVDSGSPP